MATDMTGVINALQRQGIILTAILKSLNGGLLVDPIPASYTVATLPVTAAAGQWAWASNGRKGGEGGGSGTGVPVFFNPGTATWFSYLSGVLVTA